MPASALFLALAAAVLHAGWNVLIARARDVEAATAVAVALSVVFFAPFAALTWDVDREAIPYIVAGGVLHLTYFALLAAAYRRADLGLVYPLSRGLAPALVLGVTAVALADDPTRIEAVGVLIVVAGVLSVRGARRPADGRGTAFALVIPACIAAYTLVDNEGVRHADPIPYLVLLMVGPAVVYATALALTRGARPLRRELGPSTALAAVAMFGAYILVLLALQRAPAAPVAAVRETSVVIAAVLAVVVLREPFSWPRIAGSAIVAVGISVLALG